MQPCKKPVKAIKAYPAFGRRETEVLRLIAQGYTNQEIADRLIVSKSTVANHIQNVMIKLNMHQRIQLALYAVKAGLISLDEIELP
jgi:DNA-binding NarL/FixJ family response regulator